MADAEQSLPPAAVLVRHRVANFDAWKAAFDEHEPARRVAGMLGHHISRAENDPELLSIYLALADVGRAEAFADSDDTKTAMEGAGVVSIPEFIWMRPVREAVVWDRELPAFLLTHDVSNFDDWLRGYNEADELRRSRGIVGHAANQMLDDPNVAVVYHQAETFGALRSFLDDAELKEVMKEAGVTSAPEVTFHVGGFGKQY